DARLHGGWLQAWGEPGGGSQFRLTLPRTADEPLRGSPIPLEPKDSRRNQGLHEAGLHLGGGRKLATVPVQTAGEDGQVRPPVELRPTGATATVDPTALPGDGARVVARPTGAAGGTADDEAGDETGDAEERPSQGGAEQHEQGEAFRGR